MSQRNFGQHQGGGDWNGVPDWGSPQSPQQPSSQRGGFSSSNFGSETTNSLEEDPKYRRQDMFEPKNQRGGGFGFDQPQQPYPNEFPQQGFNQGQGSGWESQGSNGFESSEYTQHPQGHSNPQFNSNHYEKYGQVENRVDAQSPKKKWSPFSIIVTVVVVSLLIFGTMIFISNKFKKTAPNSSASVVTKVETKENASSPTSDATSKPKDSDRIFPEGSSSAKEQPKSDSKQSNKPKESQSSDLGGSEVKEQSSTKNLDGVGVSSEVLVAKGTVKEIHLEGSTDLAATYKMVLSVGNATLTVSMNHTEIANYRVGDTVTVKYRKLVDVDKVVIESVNK
jgi:hypothetical protein